jgi:hypothetical protein
MAGWLHDYRCTDKKGCSEPVGSGQPTVSTVGKADIGDQEMVLTVYPKQFPAFFIWQNSSAKNG